ncbi:hypothetical protein, partial [Streptomyces melanogenes]|uniref:hypothetical protein n=1 Tax=Streptomyces melanogenes TaxID=67326 RepID=UPI001E370227
GKPELQPKAIDLTVKAIDNLRPLAARNPTYRPQLADWIMSPASALLVATCQKPRAIPLIQEAIDIYAALNQSDPVTYGPKLTQARQRLAELQ